MTEFKPRMLRAVLNKFDGNTFTGSLSGSLYPMIANTIFDVFVGGHRAIGVTTEIYSSTQGASPTKFKIHLSESINVAEARAITIKYHDTDVLVDIGPDLTGFVNNISDQYFPAGNIIQNNIFWQIVARNRSWPPISQSMIDHVTGGATRENFFIVGYAVTLDILQFGVICSPAARVFDIGCGCGRVSQFVAPLLDPQSGGDYIGFDTWAEGTRWATNNISRVYPHVKFRHIGPATQSGYVAAEAYKLDLPDCSYDAFIANSLFTHLRKDAARTYVEEVARILRPGGKGYISFFASKDKFREIQPNATINEDEYSINFSKITTEDNFTDEDRVFQLFQNSGLEVVGYKYGHWRGNQYASRGYSGYQDIFIIKKPID
jgi:SAM-dependent methyltransferase